MKLSINNAVESFKLEQELNKDIAASSHPYFGLRDQRGSLTRYPKRSCHLPSWWVRAYTDAGGAFDAMGHWGVSPDSTQFSAYCPEIASVCQDVKPITLEEVRLLFLGLTNTKFMRVLSSAVEMTVEEIKGLSPVDKVKAAVALNNLYNEMTAHNVDRADLFTSRKCRAQGIDVKGLNKSEVSKVIDLLRG